VSKRVDAVASALGSIQGFSDDEREAVVELLKVGRIRVADGREGPPTVVTTLGSRGFTWPEFDRWHAIFAASGTFPARWKGLHDDPSAQTSPAARAAYRLRKLDLLLDWLDTLRRGAAALHHYTRQGMRARIVQQGDGLRCPVCESFNGREVEQGMGTMPPIHPGCRCVLMAVTDVPFDESMGPRARHRLRATFERLA
jgi:urocanate hydratase